MTADIFYKQLLESENKISVLAKMYVHLFGEQNNKTLYPMIAKLTKAYGEKIIFFSILDCYDMTEFNSKNPYGLLSYFAKKRLEASLTKTQSKDLTNFSNEIQKIKENMASG